MPNEVNERGQKLEDEYFYHKERELIAKMRERLEAEQGKVLETGCPKCDGDLVETDFESIRIDVCNTCSGVWLDAGELAQIVDKEKTDDGGWFGKLFG